MKHCADGQTALQFRDAMKGDGPLLAARIH